MPSFLSERRKTYPCYVWLSRSALSLIPLIRVRMETSKLISVDILSHRQKGSKHCVLKNGFVNTK